MKKVLVCALAVFFLMASCSTAFAAEVTTTTTYVSGDSGKMTVTTTVTGAAEGKMYTFLVTDGEKNAENVVAANQMTVGTDGNLEFTYTGNTTDFISLSAFSGNNENNSMSSEIGLARSVTVTFDGLDANTEWGNATLTLPRHEATVPFNVDVPYNKKIASVTWDKDGTPESLNYTDGVITNSFPDDAILTVNLENAEKNEIYDVKDTAFGRIFWKKNGNEVLTVLAKVKSIAPNTEFGIDISTDGGDTWPADTNGDDVIDHNEYRFKAQNRAGSDGSFAIQLINEQGKGEMANAEFTDKVVRARVYYTTADGETVTSDSFPVVYTPAAN